MGLSTALGLMLAGAVAAGSVTGVAVSSLGSDSGGEADAPAAANDGPSNSLEAPSADAPPAEEGSVEHVASTVLPAVVSIQVVTPGSAGEGSGSIISQDGYVLTNHHVVGAAGENGTIQVTLHDGRQIPADLVASDPATDIGVIKIRDQQGLPTIQFGDSSQLNVGQEVVAVGAPLGLSGTVTSGIVSALNRPVRATQDGGESSLIDGIQTDAAINPGNSGGPLVDMNGHIIGMNSVIATASQTSGSIGLGFAIPSNFAQRVAQQLIEDGRAVQPMLGVTVDIRSQARGAQVNEVMPDGPAAQAGIEPGEVIRRIDDRAIDTADALIAAVRSQDFGETVTLEVYNPERDETRSVDVTLSEE
nr:trypsin-like peptidase domain-containing protein [Corynebacterium guangdongense]